MTKPMTVGEAVDKFGYAVLMLKVAELAEALGRIPIGEWDYRFVTDPEWRLCVNGGATETWTPQDIVGTIPRFHAYVERCGWPAALVNAAGGSCTMSESDIVAAINAEITQVKAPA